MKAHTLWNRNFVLMLQGSFISKLGDVLYSISIGWYVYQKTGSEAMLGIFSSVALFSSMLLSPLAGAIADKINRKTMLVGLDALRGVLMLFLGVLCLQNNLPLYVLITLTVIISVSGTFFNPCTSTVFMDIVPSSDLMRAQSLHSILSHFVQLAGKAASGFLLTQCGIGWLTFFNGVSFLLSAISECFITVPRTPNQGLQLSTKQLTKDIAHGFVTAATTSGLNHLFFCVILINFFTSGILNLLLIFTQQNGFSLAQYGILMSVISAGGILGSITIAAIKIPCAKRAAFFAVCAVGMPLLFFCAFLCLNFYVICTLMFAAIALNFIANIILNTALMLAIPSANRAAILGVLVTSSTGGDALSTVIYGFLAQFFSIRLVGSVGMMLALFPLLALVANKKVGQILAADTTRLP